VNPAHFFAKNCIFFTKSFWKFSPSLKSSKKAGNGHFWQNAHFSDFYQNSQNARFCQSPRFPTKNRLFGYHPKKLYFLLKFSRSRVVLNSSETIKFLIIMLKILNMTTMKHGVILGIKESEIWYMNMLYSY